MLPREGRRRPLDPSESCAGVRRVFAAVGPSVAISSTAGGGGFFDEKGGAGIDASFEAYTRSSSRAGFSLMTTSYAMVAILVSFVSNFGEASRSSGSAHSRRSASAKMHRFLRVTSLVSSSDSFETSREFVDLLPTRGRSTCRRAAPLWSHSQCRGCR
jgi:hypothetical protein